MSPYRIRTGKEHDVSILHPFGCLATVYIKPQERRGKLRPAADIGIYLGHGERSDGGLQGFRIYKYDTNKVVIRHDVELNPTLQGIKYITTVAATSADSQFINRKISKLFDNTLHHGTVHSHRKGDDGLTVWAVHYDDSDWEELDLAELLEVLKPSAQQVEASLRNTRLQPTTTTTTPTTTTTTTIQDTTTTPTTTTTNEAPPRSTATTTSPLPPGPPTTNTDTNDHGPRRSKRKRTQTKPTI
jgi:hypothetical protein